MADLSKLQPSVQDKARLVVECCRDLGIDLLIYCTTRSAQEQAKAYRRSRTIEEITRKALSLESRGFLFLADILRAVGPQEGKIGEHVTNAGPGESWHQYGRAFDAVPLVDGKCALSQKKYPAEWAIYGGAVKRAGLQWGGLWLFKDYPHAQGGDVQNPLSVLSPQQVEKLLAV